MNFSANSKRSAARIERQQNNLDAGFIEAQFPEVAGIVINMIYSKRGMQNPLRRVINFFPDSYALFRIECLNRECVNGGIDLTQVITGMIRNRGETAAGDISCEGNCTSANHAVIAYQVAIQYS